MKHSFDVTVAKQLGVNCAIILENLYFWIKKNEANRKHYHDGKYWTYNSVEAFTRYFPYLTYDAIRYALEKLQEKGYIIAGNYNALPMDKTKWYALTEKAYSLLENSQMDLGKFPDGFVDSTRAIPDNKPDRKEESKKVESESYEDIINSLVDNLDLRVVLFEFVKMRKLIKKPMTNRALKRIISKLKTLAGDDVTLATDILDQSIVNSWQDIYPLKKDYQRDNKNRAVSIPVKEADKAKNPDGSYVVF